MLFIFIIFIVTANFFSKSIICEGFISWGILSIISYYDPKAWGAIADRLLNSIDVNKLRF